MLKLYAFIAVLDLSRSRLRLCCCCGSPWMNFAFVRTHAFAEVMIHMDEQVHVHARSLTAAIVGIGDGGRGIWMGDYFVCLWNRCKTVDRVAISICCWCDKILRFCIIVMCEDPGKWSRVIAGQDVLCLVNCDGHADGR
ncbi:hypothetical protein BDB00DRAFT_112849 [Zychaea mexicana]|uniref:uncharacterized protein n=1 Tax=Zychaea mexicana TaxID=64656 RepID=UPI0022FE7D60|nr:uncharacterized protein BDB00DRAFT_112849 [Zychaea mexicana]KAI9484776.1 hypothetical protein BDB00DRAFT_112849 [Zychaea mexicana]